MSATFNPNMTYLPNNNGVNYPSLVDTSVRPPQEETYQRQPLIIPPRNQSGPFFHFFGVGPGCFLDVLVWLLSKFTCGLVEALLILSMKKAEVSEMIIAGRRLHFDASDPCLKVPILCVVNHFLNTSTCGLWYLTGMMHKYYYSEFDRRISWAEIDDESEHPQIVWLPNDSGKGNFRIYGVYTDFFTELFTWTARALSASLLLGMAEPWIRCYYNARLVPKLELGGLGQFVISYAHPPLSYGSEKLQLRFTATGFQLFPRWVKGHLISFLTFGVFVICFGAYFDGYTNKYLVVDQMMAPSLAKLLEPQLIFPSSNYNSYQSMV